MRAWLTDCFVLRKETDVPTSAKIGWYDIKVGARFVVTKQDLIRVGTNTHDHERIVLTLGDAVEVAKRHTGVAIMKVKTGDFLGRKFEIRQRDIDWFNIYLAPQGTKIVSDTFAFDDLKVGDRFMVKPGAKPMPFGDDTYLPDGTIVNVVSLGHADWGDEGAVNFRVTHGKSYLRGLTFSTTSTGRGWLTDKFTLFSKGKKTQEDTTMDPRPVTMKEKNVTMEKITKTNRIAAAAVKQGLKQAGARMAHKALIAQVEKAFGRKFPKAFFATPAGKAMLDLGSCYLVMMATEMVPQHPLATKANEVAGLALTAATYDHAVPLIEVATRLIEGAAGIDILGK
jgi:hypothetical protein